MMAQVVRRCTVHISKRQPTRRHINTIIYSRFPATLYKFQRGHFAKLCPWNIRTAEQDHFASSCLFASADGLIRPRLHGNGDTFWPNTDDSFKMLHELYSSHLEDLEDRGVPEDDPLAVNAFVLSVRAGTLIPRNLRLNGVDMSCFDLEPMNPITVEDFNAALNDFYSKVAIFQNAEKWFEINRDMTHPPNENPQTWMGW